MTETTKRILELMKQTNTNAHQLEVAVELPNASVQGWVKGKRRSDGSMREISPSAESIAKCARYFNVSADYLLGLTDERRPLSPSAVAYPQTAVTEKPASEVAENFIREFEEQMKEKAFQDIAKLYKAINDASLKVQILTVIVAYLNRNGISTESIVGY